MKTISDEVNKTQRLTSGLKNNLHVLKNKGLDEKFIKQLEIDNDFVRVKNDEIDSLKAEIKLKSKLMNLKLVDMKASIKKAKRIVKSSFEKDTWKNYGITDKR
ncbi:MAG: hypothetical protein AB7S48_02405 [Bacteroidales bacterium]